MGHRKLTFKQNLAYAHWSTKCSFGFPYFAWFLVLLAGVIYIGAAFWFFEPEVRQLLDARYGEHGLGKTYFARVLSVAVIFGLSYLTVYIGYFVHYFFERDDVTRDFFYRYYCKKRNYF